MTLRVFIFGQCSTRRPQGMIARSHFNGDLFMRLRRQALQRDARAGDFRNGIFDPRASTALVDALREDAPSRSSGGRWGAAAEQRGQRGRGEREPDGVVLTLTSEGVLDV